MKSSLFTCFLLALILVSCEDYNQDEYREYYVVESYLVANRQLPQVKVSTTGPAGAFYSFEEFAVTDANVEVRLLSGAGGSTAEQSFSYSMTDPGVYYSNGAHAVLPARTYELNITFNGSEEEITAFTTVPDTFSVIGGVRDSITYQSSEQLEITLSKSSYPGRQNIFVFNTISQDPTEENLTPFYSDIMEDEEDLELFANNSSGIINEGNFEVNPDGTFTIRYPWIGVAFYGQTLLVANTIGDNIYDFVRSQQVQLGGSTLSPGEIQNAIYHIEGGIGVFGALASDTVSTFIKRNTSPNQ